jgi:hypothetical protein
MAGGTVTITGGNVIHTFNSSGYLTPIKLVNNSLRFRASATAYLSRTPTSSPTSAQKYTQSFWVKRGTLGVYSYLYNCEPSDYSRVYFYTDDLLYFDFRISASSTSLASVQVFRDPAAWYHLVISVDTTQATSANRVKVYVNGTQITLSGTYPAQNGNTVTNSANAQRIGSYITGTQPFDGYLTEVNFIDGQALTPTSFGTTNSYGVWQPITYGGSYGTNGFYLPFTNTTSATTLAYDFSPNGNNWTPNNISSTTSATNLVVFNSSTTWTAPAGVSSVNYLVVAAGGGGGNLAGGGGGAGGYRASTLSVTSGTTYTVTIGAGGASATQGGNSVFSSITSTGGGAGGLYDGGTGGTGGSGGGGAGTSGTTGSSAGGAATSGQGSAGGGATTTGGGGGGGGGAGGGGSNAGNGNGANAGNGSSSSSITGITYAGGGGGGNRAFDAGTGGSGGSGGGGGGGGTNRLTPADGTVNTGGGGGGGGFGTSISSTGASGGSGVVVLSYTVDSMTDVPTLTSATAANYAVSNVLDIDRADITTSNGNLTLTKATANNSPRAAATFGATSGKFYAEITWTSITNTTPNDNYCVTGVTTKENWVDSSNGYNAVLYLAANNGLAANGQKGIWTAGSFASSSYGSGYFVSGSVIGIALNLDAGTVTFYLNNVSQGAITLPTTTQPWFFYNSSDGTGNGYTVNWNFGQQPWTYTPPANFVALNTYNL